MLDIWLYSVLLNASSSLLFLSFKYSLIFYFVYSICFSYECPSFLGIEFLISLVAYSLAFLLMFVLSYRKTILQPSHSTAQLKYQCKEESWLEDIALQLIEFVYISQGKLSGSSLLYALTNTYSIFEWKVWPLLLQGRPKQWNLASKLDKHLLKCYTQAV